MTRVILRRQKRIHGGGPRLGDFVYTDGDTHFLGIRFHGGRFSAEYQDLVTCEERICKQFKEAIQFLNKNRDTNAYIQQLLQGGIFYFDSGSSRGWRVEFVGA